MSLTAREAESHWCGIIEQKITNEEGELQVRRYAKGRLLGKGGFARVYELQNLHTKQKYAAKVIPKSTLTKPRTKQKLYSEIKIHRSLSHKNIVKFEQYFEDFENVYILLELCNNETLSELIRRRKKLTELEVQFYVAQLLEVLEYVHSQSVIHRDLKLSNLFLNEKLQLKLGDFGLACKLERENQLRHTICGTPNYIAPEILEEKQGHSYPVDIWSVGVIIYTLLAGKPPFETSNVKTTYNRIRKNTYSFPEGISPQAKHLISLILQLDPNSRPPVTYLLSHEFFKMNSLPPTMPISTLAVPPSEKFLQNYTAPTRSSISRKREPMQSKLKVGATFLMKWIDYSSKYGIGYLLSDGVLGVYFNDSTKAVMEDSGKFKYAITNEGTECEYLYTLKDYPKIISKKVALMKHFKKCLEDENQNCNPNGKVGIYLKKWIKTSKALVFRLSSKDVQVYFQDQSEIFISSKMKYVWYLNKKGETEAGELSHYIQDGSTQLGKRLRYTKDILNFMHNSKK